MSAVQSVLLPPLSGEAREYVASITGGDAESVDLGALDPDRLELLETVLSAELMCATPAGEIDKRTRLGQVIEILGRLRTGRTRAVGGGTGQA